MVSKQYPPWLPLSTSPIHKPNSPMQSSFNGYNNTVNSMKSQLNFRNPCNESWHLYHQQTPHSLYFTTLGHNHPPHVVIDHLLKPYFSYCQACSAQGHTAKCYLSLIG
ncbi:hypothetical protein CK203_074604 [Vitis vinifera]|uniref:Uncharacterized protein n=1 Tax=Vitis vinifera TaxID=29760 RepID=A0A438DW83_VITVI|nr:hypothetical protein CK203_074604 [Vitis vinifera]